MKIGIVVDNLVSTIKHPTHQGLKLMVVCQVDTTGQPTGSTIVAVDTACAGIGDYVLYSDEGGASRLSVGDNIIDAAIIGVLDYLPS